MLILYNHTFLYIQIYMYSSLFSLTFKKGLFDLLSSVQLGCTHRCSTNEADTTGCNHAIPLCRSEKSSCYTLCHNVIRTSKYFCWRKFHQSDMQSTLIQYSMKLSEKKMSKAKLYDIFQNFTFCNLNFHFHNGYIR